MMLSIEEILGEVLGADTNEHGLPPGFRFHPTDEELVTFYLASKVFEYNRFCSVEIAEVDINRCEPWELPEMAKMGEREWYFFSKRDRKYPTGLRTNRATEAGYWKATGKDREVYSTTSACSILIGMKKTLVFYKGRAPRGEKTKWVMHEYRLHGHNASKLQEEWVMCRVFNKRGSQKRSPAFPSHSYLLRLSSFSSIACLPPLFQFPKPLLDSPKSNLIDQESNQVQDHSKTLTEPSTISQPPILPIPGITQSPCSSFTVDSTYPLQSTSVLDTILSHQECTVNGSSTRSTTAPEQWQQAETNYHSHCRPFDCVLRWEDEDRQVHPAEMDCHVLGLSSAAAVADHTVLHEISTSSVDYNRRAGLSAQQHIPI